MGHNHIIQLLEEPFTEENGIDEESVWEDNRFNMKFDYTCGEKVDEERIKAIRRLKEEIKPFATVNVGKGTITFRKTEVVKKHFLREINRLTKEIKIKIMDNKFDSANYIMRNNMVSFGFDGLFYKDFCIPTSTIVSDYMSGWLPKTLYIGTIIDAHY